jgi:hypothetical protein
MKAFLLIGIASLAPFSAWASCKAPPAPPSPPKGVSATREEMLAAQSAIKGYNSSVVAYTECMKKEGGSEKEATEVIAQLQKLAEQFNAELRAFKQKNGAPQ